MILLDTSVLSLAYRRRKAPEPRPVTVLRRLIIDDVPLATPGIVLQEILSGIRAQVRIPMKSAPIAKQSGT